MIYTMLIYILEENITSTAPYITSKLDAKIAANDPKTTQFMLKSLLFALQCHLNAKIRYNYNKYNVEEKVLKSALFAT